MDNKKTNGQTIVEYTMVLSLIMVVILAMQPMIKRAGQGMIKMMADQIGNQHAADQRAFYTLNSIGQEGHLEHALARTQAVMDSQTVEFLGMTNYVSDDRIETDSEQQSNLGFAPKPIP